MKDRIAYRVMTANNLPQQWRDALGLDGQDLVEVYENVSVREEVMERPDIKNIVRRTKGKSPYVLHRYHQIRDEDFDALLAYIRHLEARNTILHGQPRPRTQEERP